METPVEIRYAGVVVARANEVRRMTVGGVDLFLAMPEPLPAGTVVSLGTDQQARIEKVIESPDPSVAGIYVRLLGQGEATQPWVPSFREDEVPAPRPPAVVVSPVIVKPVHAPAPPRASVPTPREVPLQARVPEPVAPPPAAPVFQPPVAEPVAPPVRQEARPPAEETPLPEVVASVVREESPPRPFTAPMPRPHEQIAMFDAPSEPPPAAVVEHAVKRERSKRSTIVVAVAPASDAERVSGAVEAVGEIDTGSRRAKNPPLVPAEASHSRPTIMVETDHYQPSSDSSSASSEPAALEPASPEPAAEAGRPTATELRLEDLSTARPLPPARGRATKRRRTTQR